MDWTPDETEVYQLMNRIRQVICKANPNAYQTFLAACAKEPERERFIKVFVGSFVLQLHHGEWFTVFALEEKGTYQVLDAKMTMNRPNFSWNAHVVRTRLVPAIDRNMILDDLSLI